MRVLVTGANGFIGRAVVIALANSGHEVRAAARRPIEAPAPGVTSVQHGDLSAEIDWVPMLAGIDAVVHLAAIAHTSGTDDSIYDQVNREATDRLAAAAAKAKIQRFVFISSIRAQSGHWAANELTESDPPAPTNAYGRSKLAAEDAVRASGVPYTILRPVVVYGPGVGANMMNLVRLCASPWPLPFGAVRIPRSVLALENLTAAILFALTSPAAANQTFIVADPSATTLADMIATMRLAMGKSPRLVRVRPAILKIITTALGRAYIWERIGQRLVARPDKLIAAGWEPAVDTSTALTRLAQSLRQ